jgi:subtilisin family serine protease
LATDDNQGFILPGSGAFMSSRSSAFARCALGAVAAAAILAMPIGAQAAAKNERVVVTFKDGGAAAARAAVARAGGRVVLDLGELNALAVRLPSAALDTLKADRRVASVEADPLRTLMVRKGTPRVSGRNAPDSLEQVPFGIPMVQADQLGFNAADAKKVCIIDAGYDLSHEDLQKTNVDGVDLTTTQLGDWNTDENSHGTHVAGTVAGLGGNGVGVVGVVPTGTLPLFIAKVFDASGSASSSAIINGVRQCSRAGAKIISMSLGGGRPTQFEERTYQRMADRGILVIAAAGNAGDTTTSYPAGYASVMSVAAIDVNMARADFSQVNADVEIAAPGVATLSTVPPNLASVATLTVGSDSYPVLAMDGTPRAMATAALADFGFGDAPLAGSMADRVCLISRGNIDFATKVLNCQTSGGVGAVIYNNVPGEFLGTLGGIATTIPSASATQADGAAMLGQVGALATLSVAADPSKYALFDGTSMATPHVSGVAALVWSNHPTCTAAQIRTTLQKSAMDLGSAGRDSEFGFGLVQAKTASDRIASMGCAN